MKIFFGAAIQGHTGRGERAHIYKHIIELLKSKNVIVISEHTSGKNLEEVNLLLEQSIGPLPPLGLERRIYVRNKMIEFVESDIDAAIFEVSTPSLGTGIEISHAYLRPRMGLPEIPILALYQKNYWQNNLSTMILGITKDKCPLFKISEYEDLNSLDKNVINFIEENCRG
jgi:hypothetical protein